MWCISEARELNMIYTQAHPSSSHEQTFSLVVENAHSAKASETYLSTKPVQSLPHWTKRKQNPDPVPWQPTTNGGPLPWHTNSKQPKQNNMESMWMWNKMVDQDDDEARHVEWMWYRMMDDQQWTKHTNNWINTQLNQLPTGPRDQVSNHQNNQIISGIS